MIEHYVPRVVQGLITGFAIDHPRCMIAADPGLGKTGGELAAVDIMNLGGSNYFPVVVMGTPRIARSVWPREQAKFDAFRDLKVISLHGTPAQREKKLRLPKAEIYTVSYGVAPWLVSQFNREGRRKWPFRWVIADESTKLKGFRFHQGAERAGEIAKIAQWTGRWNNCTGSLIPNGHVDLWGQYWFLDFGQRLGRTYSQFLDRWFFVNDYTHEIRLKLGAKEEIEAAIADITLVLRAEDYMDLEKPLEIPIEVDLPADARKHYDKMESDFFVEIGDEEGIDAMSAAAKSNKLLQMASGSIYDKDHVAHPVHEEKVEALRDIQEETGETLLVVYGFEFDVDRIRKAFPEARVLKTMKDEDDWNAGKIPMLLAHPEACGHGLNLQYGGRNVVFFSQTWNLEHRQQVIERIGPARQKGSGLNRVVRIYDIMARNTLDLEVRNRVKTKCSVQDALKAARARRAA